MGMETRLSSAHATILYHLHARLEKSPRLSLYTVL